MINRPQALLARSCLCFAVLAALLASTSACSRPNPRPLALKAVFGPVLIRPRLQVSELEVIADSKTAMVSWHKLTLAGSTSEQGIAAVDRRGRVAFKQIRSDAVMAGEADVFGQLWPNQMRLIDAETAVMAGSLYRRISGANRGKRRPLYEIRLAATLLKKGKQAGRMVILSDTDLSKTSPATFYITEKSPGRFSATWEDRKSLKRRDFAFKMTGPGHGALKVSGRVETLKGLSGLAGADAGGNVYIAKTSPIGKKDEKILVTKISKDSRVLFKDLVVGRRKQPPANLSNPAQVITGTDSFAVLWLAALAGPGAEDEPTYMFRQVDTDGRFLGRAALLKTGPAGFRIKTTESRVILGNTLAVSRRKPNIIAKRLVSWEQLDRLEAKKQPLFSTIDTTGNEFLLRTIKDFIRPAGYDSYGRELSLGVDRRRAMLDATVSRISTNTAEVTLADTDPDIVIDFYQLGRLVKTLNLGRGEDVALAVAGNDLVVAWTGGPGRVGLKLGRWRLVNTR